MSLPEHLRDPACYRSFAPLQMRARDFDQLSHVNNTVAADYLEEGRRHMLRGQLERVREQGFGSTFVVAEQTISYLREMKWSDQVEIGSRIERLGTSSFVIGQAIFLARQAHVTAQVIMVHVSEPQRISAPLPDPLRGALEKFA